MQLLCDGGLYANPRAARLLYEIFSVLLFSPGARGICYCIHNNSLLREIWSVSVLWVADLPGTSVGPDGDRDGAHMAERI